MPLGIGDSNALIAMICRAYPFKSGCGTIANHRVFRAVTGAPRQDRWTSVRGGEILAPLDDFVGRAAYFFGDLDPKISSLIERIVKADDVVLDIGANIGVVSFRLAVRVGRRGKVYAFEPNPNALAYLRRSIARNGTTQIEAVPFALGDTEGQLALRVPDGNAGAASACRGDERCQKIRIPVRTLDAFVEERSITRIDFIKIDVEGFEPNVIRGGLNSIRKLRPKAIIFESNGRTGSTFELLASAGYRIFSISRALVHSKLREIRAHSFNARAYHDCIAVNEGPSILDVRAKSESKPGL